MGPPGFAPSGGMPNPALAANQSAGAATPGANVSAGPMAASSRPKVVAKPADGPVTPTDQRTKTVGRGRGKIELRRLTPTELASRRRTRNLIMSVVFILLLGAIFIGLLNVQ